jgi:hypothetical protein
LDSVTFGASFPSSSVQPDARLGIDEQRCPEIGLIGLAFVFLLEQHLHHGHIFRRRGLQQGIFSIGQRQFVIEAKGVGSTIWKARSASSIDCSVKLAGSPCRFRAPA